MALRSTLTSIFAVLHLLIALVHTLAHQQLAIFGSAAHSIVVVALIYLAPAYALALVRRPPRRAAGWLCASLAGSFAFGVYYHYLFVSPDHVSQLPAAAWAHAFWWSALLLALCDAVGALVLAIGLLRESALLPGRRHVILVDGECIFCNRFVALILRLDRDGVFHFAHIQRENARAILRRHGRDPDDVDPIYLVANAGTPEEKLLIDGEVAREIYPKLFAPLVLVRLVPLPLLNLNYKLFARFRYRLVGKYDHCYVPTLSERARYLE
jgi:predicted DCC family thiol-disulfide oxidoreductase YuxK